MVSFVVQIFSFMGYYLLIVSVSTCAIGILFRNPFLSMIANIFPTFYSIILGFYFLWWGLCSIWSRVLCIVNRAIQFHSAKRFPLEFMVSPVTCNWWGLQCQGRITSYWSKLLIITKASSHYCLLSASFLCIENHFLMVSFFTYMLWMNLEEKGEYLCVSRSLTFLLLSFLILQVSQ